MHEEKAVLLETALLQVFPRPCYKKAAFCWRRVLGFMLLKILQQLLVRSLHTENRCLVDSISRT